MNATEVLVQACDFLGRDLVLFAESLVANILCCCVLSKLKRDGSHAHYIFCIVTSALVLGWCFGARALGEYVVTGFVLFHILRKYRRSIWCPILTTIFVVGSLLTRHFKSQIINKTIVSFDLTTLLMIYTIKFSSLAWSLHDGANLPEKSSPAHERFEKRAIREMPGLLEYYGYLFFPGGLMVGPPIHYTVYDKYMRSKHPYNQSPAIARPLLNDVLFGALFLSVFASSKIASFSASYALSDGFASISFFKKCLAIMLMSFIERSKYHTAWILSHIPLVILKIDYKGKDPKTHTPLWGATANINLRKVEIPMSPKEFLDGWNVGASEWLKDCVYLRLIVSGGTSSVLANVITSATSALWHGFLPGYYICFSSAALLTIAAKASRKMLRPLFLSPSAFPLAKTVYDLVGCLMTLFLISYFSLIFVLGGSWKNVLKYLSSVGFIGHIMCIFFILTLYFGPFTGALDRFRSRLIPTAKKRLDQK